MKLSRGILAIIAVIALMTVSSSLFAQSSAAPRSGIDRPNLLSANPIGLLFQWYNGEFEHAVAPVGSLAAAASRYEVNDGVYSSVDGIARYYPAGSALRGFSIGASLGAIKITDKNPCYQCSATSESSATIGVRADYVWILGRDQHLTAAAGVGAKRLLSHSLGGTEGVPIGRLSIGWAW